MLDKSLLRQAVMANGKQNRQTENNDKSILRRSLEKQAGVAPGSFAPTNTVVPTTPQRIYKPGAKAYAPINLRSLAESTIVPASSQEQTAPRYVSPFAKNEDYKELSRYKSTKNSEEIDNRNFLDKAIDWIIGARDNEESKKYNSVTGYTTKDYDDELYEYVNRNPDVVSRANTNEATSGQYFSGVDQSFLQEMDDAEIADYNYLYATQGKDKANEFLQNLKKDLTKRQMDKYVAENQQYARENPVAASAWSVLAKPLETVGLAGQLMDYKLDRDMDPNAGYNRFAKQNQTIRQTVPENWGKVGQFLYGTGMSIADNVYNMALAGAFGDIGGLGKAAEQVTLGLMSSSAASESVLEALENGYSADRAIIQGALAGGIEYLTEKISWGALMEPNAWKDGTIKYLLKNMRQEGLEEGISTVANWGVDFIGDLITDENRSDIMEAVKDFKSGDSHAGWQKLLDMGIDVALDVAGGALSGGVLAGGGSLVNLAANTVMGRNVNNSLSSDDVGNYVYNTFNEVTDSEYASDHQKNLAKRAMNQFDQNGKVSNSTLGELMQSNAYMESEQNARNDLLGEAMEQINSGKTVSDSTVSQILDNKRAVDFLSRNSGLQLQENMTRPERFQAVRNSLNQTIQQIDEVQAPARRVVSEIRQQNEAYQQKTDMVSQFAKTLGEQGGRTLMHMAANEDLPNITSLAGAYTKVYNEVKANPEVNLNEVSDEIDNRFTPSQLYSVYQAAVADRETDFKENGVPYEGETTNGRSEDNGGNGIGQTDVDSGVGVESISRWTAEAEKGNQTSERARIIAKNQAAVSGQPKVTAQEAGFANGSNRDEHRTTQVVPEENWASLDEDTYSFFKELKSQGYNVIGYVGNTFFEDPLSTNDRGEHPVVTMRGFQQGKTIGVRVDAELSARQIIMHELFHDMVASDSALQGRMLDKLNDKYKGRMDRVFEDYVRHYEWMLPEDATPEQIKEWENRVYNEILADAYAGIDIYEDLEMNYEGATQVSADVRGFLSENGVKTRNGNNAGQFSRDTENKYLEAIKSGDTDTAQQIVDEAAKEAGYTIKAYHGTTENFNSFSRNKQGTNHDGYLEFGAGFYFTPNADEAREWVRRGRSGQSGKAAAKVMSVYLNPGRIIGADDAIPEAVSTLQTMGLSKADANFLSNRVYRLINYLLEEKGFSNTEVQETLKGFGYDAIDASYGSAIGKPSGQYVVFDPEQIKSADSVTYDDNGEPISLSDRFNAGKNDIRYSRDKWQMDGQMSLSDLEDFYQEKYDNVSEENIKTAAKETKGIIERIQNFQDKEVRNKSEKRVLGNIRTVALGITSEFIKTGYIDFGGLKLSKNPSKAAAQIASYAMILRNPNFETFRVLYTKGNQIVGNSAVTSYNVDTSYAALDKDMETSNGMIRDQMKRLGADGYYLMHNHPSGSVNYSNADKQMTDYYRKTIAGFKGHIIIDHNQYGFFDASPDMKYSVNDIENGNAKDIHSRRIDSPLLYNVINGPESLADIARYVVHNNDVSTLIYAHKDGIRAIQEVSNKFLLSKDFKNYVNNRKLDFGSVQTFLVTNMETFNKVDGSNLFSTGIFTDVVGDGETDELFGKSFYSLHELGRGQWGTVKEAGLHRVYEEDNGAPTQYSLDDKAPEDFTDKQKAAYEYNVNATFSDKLKTLGGSDIKRSKFGAGKEIGGKVYLHRDYANEVLPEDVFDAAKQILAEEYPDFEYNCVEYGLKDGSVRFDEAPGFDTEREPMVGDYVTVNADGTTRKGHTDYIWHHKWLWVKDDYQGFDVQESWNWSRKWLSTISGKTYDVNGKAYTDRGIADGNGLTRWNAQMDAYGLPKDTYRFSVDSDETPVYQAHTSRGTSINTVKIPALYTKVNAKHGFRQGTTNIDIGAGVEGTPATKYLADIGVNSLPFDPFNRDRETNIKVLDFLQSGKKADTATCSNVLNVIDNADARANIVLEMAKSIKPDGTAYFTVYEDKKNLEAGKAGESKNKPDQWQEFRATKTYEDEIRRYFNSVETKNNVIIANEPKPNLPEAKWQITSTEYTDKQGNKPYDRDEVIRYSRDTDYMDAVNSGDMDTAQRMVDEAAKAAGYTIDAYHGTNSDFTVFDPDRIGTNYHSSYGGFYFRSTNDVNYYGKNTIHAYLKMENPMVLQASDDFYNAEDYYDISPLDRYYWAKSNGHDGIIVKHKRGNLYVVFDSEQIKSADPVTYDDNGNVIPLSERFNAESNDIRFSRDTAADAFNELYTTLEDGRIKPNSVEDLSTEDWKLIYKAVNKLGYGMESVKQTKEVYSRYVGENGFNKEQSEAIKKAYGVTETYGITANPKREALARKTFGTTGDFREAGYLMRNGSMLDFSGKKDGGPAHVRYMDHREIESVFSQGEIPGEKTQYGDNTAYMNAFISEGNIRLMEGQGVTIGEMEPTSQQYTILKQFIDHVLKDEDYFYLDLSNNDGYTVASRDYSSSDGAQKIIRDIKEYFKNGELPYRSDLAQFRYSRDTTGMESELQKQNRDLNRELKEVTERYHYFKDQLVLTKARQATEQSANRVAKQLVKDYSSNVSADEIAKALREASKLVLNVKDDTDIDELQTQLKDALRPYAMQMVTNASELMNAEDVETQKSIRNDLRNGAGIIVTDQMKKDVPDWASFRKAQFGNMKLVSGPKTNIHDVYLELSQKYGEGYFPADVANESDMLQVIADVMADLSAIYDNPYTYGGANIAEAIESCTNDMMMSVVGSLEAKQPTFADKEKAKRDKLRKEAIEAKNAALQRVREQRDDALAKQTARYKDRIKSIYDKRQQYELRTRIRKKVKDLADKLTKPTDDKHIPYALQGAVIDVLNQINTGSKFDLTPEGSRVERGEGIATRKTNAFLKLKEQLTELRGQLVLDDDLFDSEDSTGILSDLALFPDTSIDALNSEDLQKVLTVIQSCENAVRTWNRMFNEAKWAEISEAGEAIYSENADKVGRPEYTGIAERTIDLLTVDILTPEAYFSRMKSSGRALFKMLRAAQDENIRILKEAQDYSQENGLYDLKLKDYENKMLTVRFGNRDVEMSKAQLMELYILNKREASRAHIEVGGILPEPVQKKFSLKKVTYAEPIRNVTQEDIAKAMAQLSPEEIRIAEALQTFVSTTMTKHGNDTAMKVYGYKKFGEENYWPIRVNDQDLKTELGTVRTRARSVSKKGFTNAIKPKAKQSVVIGSIFDTYNEHVAEMANYASHLAVMEDMKRIYNFTEKDADGAIEVSTKYIMRNVFGPQGTKYFEKLMQDLSNGTVSEQAYFGGLIGRFKAAAVGSNLRVILQQPTAIFRAMDMISPRYLAQGLTHVKSGMERALKNAPIAQWKDWGYFDINTGRSTKNILFENSSTLDRVQNVLMSGAGLADSISWGALYSAVEAEIKDTRPDLDARSNAFNEVVAERFADIIDHSQVVDGVLQRSGIMRSENAIDKMATSFMAEPTKQFNMLASAIYNFRHSTKENKAQAGKVLARTTAAMLFAGVLNAAVQSIVDAIRDDDPEKDYWEKFLAKFTGDEATISSFLTSNVGDFLNPAQYVPYAKDIVSIIQGYDVERMDVSLINDLYTDGKAMVNAFQGKGKYSMTNTIMNFTNTAAKFLGLSTGNVKRDVAGIANTIAQETGSYVFEYRMAKFTYNLNQATNKGRFVEVLAKAYEAGDREAFNIILKDLIREDKFATTTMTTEEWIKKRLKDKHQIILK